MVVDAATAPRDTVAIVLTTEERTMDVGIVMKSAAVAEGVAVVAVVMETDDVTGMIVSATIGLSRPETGRRATAVEAEKKIDVTISTKGLDSSVGRVLEARRRSMLQKTLGCDPSTTTLGSIPKASSTCGHQERVLIPKALIPPAP
jgi:hypothetical protein